MGRAKAAAVVGALALVVAGYGAADAADYAPGILTTDPVPAEPEPFPAVEPPGGRVVAPAVTGPDNAAPVPTAAGLQPLVDALRADPRMTGSAGVVVADAVTGQVLLDADGATPRVPASTVKTLTAAAALDALGPETVLRTTVVRPAPDEVVLVGGGDALLAPGAGNPASVVGHAGLGDLATATAQALAAEGVTSVSVGLDDMLFTGPVHAAGWSGADLDFVMPVQPIAVEGGVEGRGFVDDPAAEAADTFAAALAAAGIAVTGPVARTDAPADAPVVAEVSSAPIGAVVRHALKASDNGVTEILGRLVALQQGKTPDFNGAVAGVRDQLAGLGIDVTGVDMRDTSGLDMASTVPPRVITDVLLRAAGEETTTLRGLLPAMPVGGLDGTLAERLSGDAAGRVRAKTGTLTVASALAGTVVDADGRLLVFAALTDGLQVGTTHQARAALDSFAASLAACGCTG